MFQTKLVVLAVVSVIAVVLNSALAQPVPKFKRGDCNFHQVDHMALFGDKYAVDIADIAAIMGFVFASADLRFQPPCLDSCDANDDGLIDIQDAIYLLRYQFQGGIKPPEPFDNSPGHDATPDGLNCVAGEHDERLNIVNDNELPPSNRITIAFGSRLGPQNEIIASPGFTIDVCFYLWNPPRETTSIIPPGIQGLSLAICFDDSFIGLDVAQEKLDIRGGILEKLGAEYIAVHAENNDPMESARPGELVIGVFLDIKLPFEGKLIPEKNEFQLLGCVPFIVNSKSPIGNCTAITLCDGANGRNLVPILNLVSSGYLSWPVLPMPGGICIKSADQIDSDGDGLTDAEEVRIGTDSQNPDTDDDGIFDGYEAQYPGCLNPLEKYDAGFDCDGDNSPNQEEFYYGTDPTKADSLPVWAPEDVRGTPIPGGLFLQWNGSSSKAVKHFTIHLEPVAKDGGGGGVFDFVVPSDQNSFVATGLLPETPYSGKISTWDFADKEYPCPCPAGGFKTSTPAIWPEPTRVMLNHPIVFVPGVGTKPDSPRFQPIKSYLISIGLSYGGNFWYDSTKKPPGSKVAHGPVDPQGSIFDVAFSDPSGSPLQHGKELSEMVQAIKQVRTQSTDKVILIGWSLGGLSARCYIQNTSVYKNDVAKLITIGTPNLGIFPDHANYKDAQGNPIQGVWNMILDKYYGYAHDLERFMCSPSVMPGDTFFYVRSVMYFLKDKYVGLGWDFSGPALAMNLLFTDSTFMNLLNQPHGTFSNLPKNTEYWALIGHDSNNLALLWAGFMNAYLRNCPETSATPICQIDCSKNSGGDGFISGWSQDLSKSLAATDVAVKTEKVNGVNHKEEGEQVEPFLKAIGLEPVTFVCHSPVHLEVTDPLGRTTSRYRWEIPGAFVREGDTESNGDVDESVSIFFPLSGEYEVRAIPKLEAPPDATYSITVEMNGEITELAKDRPVSEIPVEPEKVFINTRPMALVKGPELVFVQLGEQAQVRLDGSLSYDIDNDPLTYRWVWDGELSSEISPLFNLGSGTYEFQLTVNDGFNDSETKDFFVTVLSLVRGDANGDGERDISDAIAILGCLFLGTKCPVNTCFMDVNSDGTGDISDSVYLLSFLFLGGPAPKQCLTP